MLMTKGSTNITMDVFENLESEVRSYSRSFPTVFEKAKGYRVWDTNGKEYIDFFAGAGTLNYGHNNEAMKDLLIEYIQNDNITHSLDMATIARGEFLQKFSETILQPRQMDYKVMFPGPTGTNAVESALKLARKVTGRRNIMSFSNGFHGMTIGSLAITSNASKRAGAGIPLEHTVSMPFDNAYDDIDSLTYIEQYLANNNNEIDLPAAIILETVQGEGGINAASYEWLQGIEKIARKYNMLFIVDDIQAGCGRTGFFFSFEDANLNPDIICLSKSIGGFGLPMAIVLMKREYDKWQPGEHNGTFRGNNLAFVGAKEALSYWEDDQFSSEIQEKSSILELFIEKMIKNYPALRGEARGRGLMQGIACGVDGLAEKICAESFKNGLLMETSGPKDEVFKFLPPLIIDHDGLFEGLSIIDKSIQIVLEREGFDL